MISAPTFQPFFQDLQGLLSERLLVVTARDASLNSATSELPLLVNQIVGTSPEENTRRWIVGAKVILEEVSKRSITTPPPFVMQALEVWSQTSVPLDKKLPLIEGIHLYFQEALGTALGRETSRVPPRRSVSTTRFVAVKISSSLPPPSIRFEYGSLEDGGLSILRQVEELEFKVPKDATEDQRHFAVTEGLRKFVEAERVPMVVVQMMNDEGLGRMSVLNESFRQKFGWTDAEIKKKPLRHFFHLMDVFSIATRIFLIMRGGYFQPSKLRFLRADGGYWRITGAGVVKHWHGNYYGIGVLSDIQEA